MARRRKKYESASLRNVFLTAALELPSGMPRIPAPKGASSGMARAMSTLQWWNAAAIRVDSQPVDRMEFSMNFLTPDAKQQFVVDNER